MVVPVGDVNPTRRTPVLTGLFLLINVGVFVLLQPRGGCPEAAFLFEWAAVPRELTQLQPLTDAELRPIIGQCTAEVDPGKPVLLSAVSAMFLHGGLWHLLGNMLFLWVFGNNVEDRLGHLGFALFYVIGGLAATAVFVGLHPDSTTPLLGASGAIAAVLGAYLVMFPRAPVHTYVPFPLYLLAPLIPRARITSWFLIFAVVTMPAWLVLGLWFGLQVVSSSNVAAGAGVAYEAHVAGFVAGILLLAVIGPERARERRQPTARW